MRQPEAMHQLNFYIFSSFEKFSVVLKIFSPLIVFGVASWKVIDKGKGRSGGGGSRGGREEMKAKRANGNYKAE